MKRLMVVISILLLIWLHISYGTFGQIEFLHNNLLKTMIFLDSFNKNISAIIAIFIPLFCIISCGIDFFYEKSVFLKIGLALFFFVGVFSLQFFLFVILMSLHG